MKSYRYLKTIFGDEFESLSEREIEVSLRVLGWCIKNSNLPESGPVNDVTLICDSIRSAVMCVSGLSWDVLASKDKGLEKTEYRYIAFHILRSMSCISQGGISSAIGIHRDHATISYALKQCSDWLDVDKEFKRKYDTVLFLTKVGMQGGDIKETYENLNK